MNKSLVAILICLAVMGLNGSLYGAQTNVDPGPPFATKPANVITVAKSGGDYTSISAALAAINPTADNPYIVKVMPGTYNESVTMKSYVHLQGAGRDVTSIVYYDDSSIICDHVSNVMISGFDLEGDKGVYINGSSPTIFNNLIKNSGNSGIYAFNSSAIIKDNVFENAAQYAIRFFDAEGSSEGSSPVISNNKIVGGGGGIRIASPSVATITNNIIKEVQGNSIEYVSAGRPPVSGERILIIGNIIEKNRTGINISADKHIIMNNKVTSNTIADLSIVPGSNISFNIYDTFVGSGAFGNYNLKSDGTPAPLQ